VASLFRKVFADRFAWKVLLSSETSSWLDRLFLDTARAQAEGVHEIAGRAVRWTNDLLSRLKQRGVLEALDREDPAFFDDGKRMLVSLHRELGMGQAQ
jgi:hypothetical protein